MAKKYWNHPEYAEWITRHECVDCGGYTGQDRFGEWRCDASHVKTKGSGGGEYNNLIPQCRNCHIKFEQKTRDEKREYIKLAQDYYKAYCDGKLDYIEDSNVFISLN